MQDFVTLRSVLHVLTRRRAELSDFDACKMHRDVQVFLRSAGLADSEECKIQ